MLKASKMLKGKKFAVRETRDVRIVRETITYRFPKGNFRKLSHFPQNQKLWYRKSLNLPPKVINVIK